MWTGVGKCLLLFCLEQSLGLLAFFFLAWYGWALQASFIYSCCPFGFFFLASINIFSNISVALPLLGGNPCRSVGDQPPVLTPRGDPTRLGDLSVDPPLVELLYSVWVAPLLRIIFLYLSGTQGGAGSPPPLVEVNQAILAWSALKHMADLNLSALKRIRIKHIDWLNILLI